MFQVQISLFIFMEWSIKETSISELLILGPATWNSQHCSASQCLELLTLTAYCFINEETINSNLFYPFERPVGSGVLVEAGGRAPVVRREGDDRVLQQTTCLTTVLANWQETYIRKDMFIQKHMYIRRTDRPRIKWIDKGSALRKFLFYWFFRDSFKLQTTEPER